MLTDADRAQLVDFLAQLKGARLPERDPEAARLINVALLVQPDGAQLLVLKCLLQQHALEDLRYEVEQLRMQLAQRPVAGATAQAPDRGFLSRLFGAAPAPAPTQAMPPGAAYAAPVGGSGVLGSIASTAAGVAAGEFLFSGVEHLLHGDRANGFGSVAGFDGGRPENVTINEYYGSEPGGRGGDGFLSTDDPVTDSLDDSSDGSFDV